MPNIVVDIETIPDQAENAQNRASELVKVPANYRDPIKIAAYKIDHAEEAWLKTGLHGIAGEIVSIAWAVDDRPVDAHIRLPGDSESELLDAFFDDVSRDCASNGQGRFPRITWIGHNLEFDLRFIKQRCLINNTRPPFIIPADARHGSESFFCTMKEWSGFRGFVSLDALAKAFGFEGKQGMSGKDVWPTYQAGEYEKIREYNIADVALTRKIYRRMTWRDQ